MGKKRAGPGGLLAQRDETEAKRAGPRLVLAPELLTEHEAACAVLGTADDPAAGEPAELVVSEVFDMASRTLGMNGLVGCACEYHCAS